MNSIHNILICCSVPNLKNYCLADSHLGGDFSQRNSAVSGANKSHLLGCKTPVVWPYSPNERGYSFGDEFWGLFSSLIHQCSGSRRCNWVASFSNLGQCRNVLLALLFPKQPSPRLGDTLGRPFPPNTSLGHFVPSFLRWNKTGSPISADCHIGKFCANGYVVRNPSSFRLLPITSPRLNHRRNGSKSERREAAYPVGLMGHRIFRGRYVSAQSSRNVKRPSYITDGVRSRIGQGVNVPSAWCSHVVFNVGLNGNYTHLCGHAGEHDALLSHGWHTRTWTARKGYALTDEAVANSAGETLWCSPHCVPVSPVLDLFSAMEAV